MEAQTLKYRQLQNKELQTVISVQQRQKEMSKAMIAGKPIPMRKITLQEPADSSISSGLKRMGGKRKTGSNQIT